MKKIALILLLVVSMMFTAACGGKKDEPADTSSQETEAQEEEKKEASEATSSQVTEETSTETEKTEWGNDEYGYITLSSDWHKFVTSDVSAEQNANMLQWQSSDMRNIVTITSGTNSPEDIIMGIASSEEPDTYAVDVYGEDGDDYRIGYFGKWYEDEDLWLVIYTLATDYSDKTYYFSFEGTGYENEDEFLEKADEIFFTHSEFKKTSLYRGMNDYNLQDSDSSVSSGKVDVSGYKAGDKYPIYDFITDELILEVTIPDGFSLDGEYCEKDLLALDKDDTIESIWVEGYLDYDVEEYLETGQLNEEVFGKYSDLSANIVEEFTLENGYKGHILEIKYHDDQFDWDTHRYNVSIAKDEEIGVSFTLSEEELKEMGFKSIKEVTDLLFD